ASHNAVFTGIQQTDSLNDFALQPAGVFNDLCVKITPLGPFRSGFDQSYMVNYSNVGTTTLNPTVIFFPDNDVSFVSANPVVSSVTLDSLVWNFGPLAPFQSGQILIIVNVNIGIRIGTLINSVCALNHLQEMPICYVIKVIGKFILSEVMILMI
ncbi:MAG: hypothetical protein IPP34_10875, partial [Bacteroidetes bacterium]|nr:hypothetical protein [Bacteroidota bacterium]